MPMRPMPDCAINARLCHQCQTVPSMPDCATRPIPMPDLINANANAKANANLPIVLRITNVSRQIFKIIEYANGLSVDYKRVCG